MSSRTNIPSKVASHTLYADALRGFFIAVILLTTLLWVPLPDARANEPWILIDTGKMTLSVMDGDQVLETYDDIAIGRNGTTKDKLRQDNTTPLGQFRIVRISTNSRFHRFFGIDYPKPEHAKRAYISGQISEREYTAIRLAFRKNKTPPQDTGLGGYIGIHGIGAGDPEVHETYNWTNGCVALTNEQIDDLSVWVHEGTRVVIR